MSQHETEPYIVVTVRELIKDLRDDLNAKFNELAAKLDDRATVGMFRALQSDLAAAFKRIEDLEEASDQRFARTQGVNTVIGWLIRFGGWLIATGLGVAWLWLTVSHG